MCASVCYGGGWKRRPFFLPFSELAWFPNCKCFLASRTFGRSFSRSLTRFLFRPFLPRVTLLGSLERATISKEFQGVLRSPNFRNFTEEWLGFQARKILLENSAKHEGTPLMRTLGEVSNRNGVPILKEGLLLNSASILSSPKIGKQNKTSAFFILTIP